MTMHRATRWFVAALVGAFVGMSAAPDTIAFAQVGKLVDPNAAAESELTSLPGMTPAIVKTMIERRPFKTVVELNRFLLDQKLTPEQAKAFYGKAFVPINLNTGTRDEFLLIPGVGSRMSAEFMEYRPWKSWAQFDKEIGKYVGQQETDRFKPYVFIPPG
jgi:DNA uptake protein ComE-like DNA-binding protein